MSDWLPEHHLARFVVEIVEQLDLKPMERAYGTSGSDPYHPALLLSVLVYGYATGVFSSRKLENATHDSVAFRFVAANEHPDHNTLNTFRKRFLKEIEGLMVQVLLIARTMGVLIPDFLEHVSVRDIPGIGGNRQALLNKFDIRTAADFADVPEREIKRLLGKAGTDLWHELNGTSIYKIETEVRMPKSMARTASMGEVTQDKATIRAHLLKHAMRLSKELITKRLTARQLTVFLTLKSFDKQASTSDLPYPSADYFLLASEAGRALDALYDTGCHYRACGLIANDIAIRQSGSFDLFQMAEQQREEKHLKLLETLHIINHKHGNNVLTICGAMQKRRAGGAMGRFGYPVLECG